MWGGVCSLCRVWAVQSDMWGGGEGGVCGGFVFIFVVYFRIIVIFYFILLRLCVLIY